MANITREYLDKKFSSIDKKFDGVDKELKDLKSHVDTRFEQQNKDLKSHVTKEVEAVLSKGMDQTFAGMPPDLQLKFKIGGEETAQKIRGLLSRAKEKAREILELIKSWLRLIPGVSRYFLEQEAKIKTDEILKIADEQKDVTK